MPEEKSPLGKPRADPVSLASGEPHLVRLSLFGFGLSELGKKPINWGNSILIGMIGLMVVGGGGFVITREKLVNVKFGDTRKVDDEYPADVVEMLPKIAGLKADARKSLKNVLDNKKVDKVLDLMDAVVRKDEE